MEDIITFYKVDPTTIATRVFGYVHNNKFILKRYDNESNSISFLYWTDHNSQKSLTEHAIHYFTLPGLKQSSLTNPIECQSNIGKYYNRIYRKGLDSRNNNGLISIFYNYEMETLNQSVISATILIKKLNQLFETISFNELNFKTFGHEIRNLLLLTCMEVESAWNGIMGANNYSTKNGRLTTKDYYKLYKPLYLKDFKIRFKLYPEIKLIQPFENWEKDNPTKSLIWYDAYNKAKHNREVYASLANFEAVLYSISAMLIMLYAQFGPNHSFWGNSEFSSIEIISPEHNLNDYYIPNGNPQLTNPFQWTRTDYSF